MYLTCSHKTMDGYVRQNEDPIRKKRIEAMKEKHGERFDPKWHGCWLDKELCKGCRHFGGFKWDNNYPE